MTITAKIIADSIADDSPRLTTFVLKYPRFIHPQVLTHRVFSRNSSSSRAIPVKTLIKRVQDDPAIPLFWGKNQKGMQPNGEIIDKQVARIEWIKAKDNAIQSALALSNLETHKEICNRILEPFAHVEVILTGTDFQNFFDLRTDSDAQAEIQYLALEMQKEYVKNTPKTLKAGEWHLPLIAEAESLPLTGLAQKVSAARCARVSYLKHDGQAPSTEEDVSLFNRLMVGKHIHASPCEHQAKVPTSGEAYLTSNLRGWSQFRKLIEAKHFE